MKTLDDVLEDLERHAALLSSQYAAARAQARLGLFGPTAQRVFESMARAGVAKMLATLDNLPPARKIP